MGKADKTNVMRVLERAKIPYKEHMIETDRALSGVEIAERLGLNVENTFKTLVTVGKSRNYYVFIVPVAEELDLKKAALAAGEKSIEMLKSKDLLPLTGYVHGGCSPIGMKKQFTTFIHNTASRYETIIFSGGKIGFHVELPLADLRKVLPVTEADIIV